MMNWFRKHLTNIYLKNYIREVIKVIPEEMIDEHGKLKGVDVTILACDHVFWQEKNDPRLFSPRLCETCLLDSLLFRYGTVDGWRKFRKWEKWGKVKYEKYG